MSAERRQILRGVLSVLMLTSGVLVAVSIDYGATEGSDSRLSPATLDAPRFSVWLGRNRLILAGTTVSKEQESGLMQLVSDQFAGHDIETDFEPGLFVPQIWDTWSTRLLYLVAATNSAEASIGANGIEIRGVTSDQQAYQHRLEFLQSALPAGATVNADVVFAASEISLGAMCQRAFSTLAVQPVSFQLSSTEIRLASYALLDRLIEFSYECRGQHIAITGHSDASGNEAQNLQISRARAQAVADYLVRGGVASELLIVEGLGTIDPIADNDTAHGRALNRRIEFELR